MDDEQISEMLVLNTAVISELLIRIALLPGGKQKRVMEQSMQSL
jgi:hypothetical protein